MSAYERFRVIYVDTAIPQPLVQGDGDSLSNDIVLADTTNELVLRVTMAQYTKLLSAAYNGAQRAYPNEYLEVVYPLIKAGKLSFCDEVADCIDTSAEVQTSINNYFTNETTIQNIVNNFVLNTGVINPNTSNPLVPEIDSRFPEAERDTSVTNPPAQCDLDALWAGIFEIVTRIDQMVRDFYESVVANVDKVERITAIIDLVPLFGDTVADVIQIFADVCPDLLNAYNAHSSQQVLEDTACALFNIVCSECRYPTYTEIYDHYASFGITGIQDIAAYGVQAAVDYLIGSNGLANSVVWYTSQAIALQMMYYGGNWLNYRGTKWLAIWADIGEDTPSNGWELLCDPCQVYPNLIAGDNLICCDLWPSVAGSLVYEGSGVWLISSTPSEGQHALVVQEENGFLFTLTTVQLVSGSTPFRRWCEDDCTTQGGNFALPPTGTDMYGFRLSNTSAFSVRVTAVF